MKKACPMDKFTPCIEDGCMAWQTFDCDKEVLCNPANIRDFYCGFNPDGVCIKPKGYCKLIDKEGL